MHVNELAAESIFIDDREFYNENSRDSHNLCEAITKIFTIMNILVRKRSKAMRQSSVMHCHSDIVESMKF